MILEIVFSEFFRNRYYQLAMPLTVHYCCNITVPTAVESISDAIFLWAIYLAAVPSAFVVRRLRPL